MEALGLLGAKDSARLSLKKIPGRRIISFRNNLLPWFESHGRPFPWRRPTEPVYRVVVTEILLQRTRADVVARSYNDFFSLYPSWKMLSQASRHELENSLKPLGLWQRRAETLLNLASAISQRRGCLPTDRCEIEQLPGVGQYVANAIELVVWDRPLPLLDTNMARILERYFGPRLLSDIRYDRYLQELALRMVDCAQAKLINWGILDLAALVCTYSNPRCPDCPLSRGCNYSRGISCSREDQLLRQNGSR